MFDLHNETRTAYGLGPLCLSSVLTSAARVRSQDMLNRDYFSHYTPGGVSVIDLLRRKGHYSSEPGDYHVLGENIAMGGDGYDEDTPEHLFTGLMQSEGHRENILRGEFEEVGLGARSGTYQEYDDISTIYTAVFGGR
ncbi:MAG TPA: CAP domain-containing protein [Rubrobacter sp.]|nr:CAP domain-containing protein [Rubrobacter sp.]